MCVRSRNSEVGSLFFSSSSMSASAASATRYVSLESGMCVIEAEVVEKRSRRTLVLVAHTAAALVLILVLGFTPAATLAATLAASRGASPAANLTANPAAAPAAAPAEHLRGGGHPLTAFAKARSVRAPAETTVTSTLYSGSQVFPPLHPLFPICRTPFFPYGPELICFLSGRSLSG